MILGSFSTSFITNSGLLFDVTCSLFLLKMVFIFSKSIENMQWFYLFPHALQQVTFNALYDVRLYITKTGGIAIFKKIN